MNAPVDKSAEDDRKLLKITDDRKLLKIKDDRKLLKITDDWKLLKITHERRVLELGFSRNSFSWLNFSVYFAGIKFRDFAEKT